MGCVTVIARCIVYLGTLPSELGLMNSTVKLSLSRNKFHGTCDVICVVDISSGEIAYAMVMLVLLGDRFVSILHS